MLASLSVGESRSSSRPGRRPGAADHSRRGRIRPRAGLVAGGAAAAGCRPRSAATAATPSSSEGTRHDRHPDRDHRPRTVLRFPARGGRLRRIVAATGLLAALTVTAGVWRRRPNPPPPPVPLADQSVALRHLPSTDAALERTMSGILEAHLADREFVGAVLALRQADGTHRHGDVGHAVARGDSGAVDPDIPWGIGSVTKAFVAVVRAANSPRRAHWTCDAGIDTFLPELPAADRITPRQLLQHTSGLGDLPATSQPCRATRGASGTPAELTAVAEAAGRTGEPGRAACLLQHQLHPARPRSSSR